MDMFGHVSLDITQMMHGSEWTLKIHVTQQTTQMWPLAPCGEYN